MTSYKEYFDRVGYKPQYVIGDRVQGTYKKIPFRGTVGNDRCINGVNPEITIHLDLPMRLTDGVKSVIIVAHKDIRPLT
jgi:hypothetical protein